MRRRRLSLINWLVVLAVFAAGFALLVHVYTQAYGIPAWGRAYLRWCDRHLPGLP